MFPVLRSHLRIARSTSNLNEAVKFYRDGLGFQMISSFEDHEGFDGVMLGSKGLSYHLEFTHHRGYLTPKSPSKDNLLVFYLPDRNEWKKAVERMEAEGFEAVKSLNPYWNLRGKTFEDIDGYRVVLQNAEWH